MSFLTFWRKPKNKASSKAASQDRTGLPKGEELLSFDLFYQMSYMSAVAAAGIPRSQIFERAANLQTRSSKYFKDVYTLCRKMGYDYSEACRLVGESVKEDVVKSLLLRLSNSLGSGTPEREFLAQEAKILGEAYANDYERRLEGLRKWTDAYTALAISSALVIIVAMISTLIYKIGMPFVMMLSGAGVGASILGAWIIERTAVREAKTISTGQGPRKARLSQSLFKMALPLAMVVAALLFIMHAPIGLVVLIAGVMVFPIGWLSVSNENAISKRDEEVGTFLRSLGSTASSIGTTTSEALQRIDLRSLGTLNREVKQLSLWLSARIKPEICWRRFVSVTGSAIVARSVAIFQDAVSLGGDAQEVGERSSLLSAKVSSLRAKRGIITSPFSWLCIVMHGAIGALLVFVVQILNFFGDVIKGMSTPPKDATAAASSVNPAQFFSFNFADLQTMNVIVVVVLVALSVVNAMAAKAAEGGHANRFFYHLGIMLAVSGICLLVVPQVAKMIFGMSPS